VDALTAARIQALRRVIDVGAIGTVFVDDIVVSPAALHGGMASGYFAALLAARRNFQDPVIVQIATEGKATARDNPDALLRAQNLALPADYR
jgi:hypothetical protein